MAKNVALDSETNGVKVLKHGTGNDCSSIYLVFSSMIKNSLYLIISDTVVDYSKTGE